MWHLVILRLQSFTVAYAQKACIAVFVGHFGSVSRAVQVLVNPQCRFSGAPRAGTVPNPQVGPTLSAGWQSQAHTRHINKSTGHLFCALASTVRSRSAPQALPCECQSRQRQHVEEVLEDCVQTVAFNEAILRNTLFSCPSLSSSWAHCWCH
jgi:hypothetical protein